MERIVEFLPYIAIGLGAAAGLVSLWVIRKQAQTKQRAVTTYADLNGKAGELKQEIKKAIAASSHVL